MNAPPTPRYQAVLIRDLHDLKLIRRELETRLRLEQAVQAAKLAAAAKIHAEKNLFIRAIGPVRPLPVRHRPGHRALLPTPPAAPIPVQLQLDELAVMQEALSDGFDVENLLETDEALSYRQPGIGPDVVRKLRKGHWSIQAQLDLHGLRRDDARNALGQFLRDAQKLGWRCLRVVHGKGLGSPGKTPILKGRVQSWLMQKREVLAFVQARPADGGAGALVVLLAPGGGIRTQRVV